MCSCVVFIRQAHMEAVHADWKEYLNLLICEENHLKHMDEYHKVRQNTRTNTPYTFSLVKLVSTGMFMSTQFHKEARDTQDLLKRLQKELDQKYNPEFKDMYQMEGLIMEIDVSSTRSKEHTSSNPFKITESSAFFFVCLGPSQSHGAH